MANQKTFTEIVAGQVAAVQARSAGIVDFTTGSVVRAIIEAAAQVMLWLQGVILAVAASTRAATSTGAELDSWMADFGLTRLPARAATGEVTFSRFTAVSQVLIPVGATLETGDGTQAFIITLDLDHPNLNGPHTHYLMGVGAFSLTVPAAAVTPGAAGNVAPGAINTMTSAVPGVDTVVNAESFSFGADQETDAALRARFQLHLLGLSRGTLSAVIEAAVSVTPGTRALVVEGQTYAGEPLAAYFYVVVDDGTGAPSAEFLADVADAIDAVRPLGSTFGVYPPENLAAAVAFTVTAAPGFNHAEVELATETAVAAYIDALTLGTGLIYTRLIQVVYDAHPGVLAVSGLTLNGGAANIASNPRQAITAGVITATVT